MSPETTVEEAVATERNCPAPPEKAAAPMKVKAWLPASSVLASMSARLILSLPTAKSVIRSRSAAVVLLSVTLLYLKVSRPRPPVSVSRAPPPASVSSPWPARMASAAEPPVISSLPDDPVIVKPSVWLARLSFAAAVSGVACPELYNALRRDRTRSSRASTRGVWS